MLDVGRDELHLNHMLKLNRGRGFGGRVGGLYYIRIHGAKYRLLGEVIMSEGQQLEATLFTKSDAANVNQSLQIFKQVQVDLVCARFGPRCCTIVIVCPCRLAVHA